MDEHTRLRLLRVALAQRGLSIGFGLIPAVIVVGGVAAGFTGGGRELMTLMQVVIVLVLLYVAAMTFELSRALEDARGLRLTLAVAVAFVPFAALIVPPMMLWRARRRLRARGVDAGFLTVGRKQMEWLRREPWIALTCAGCGYDLTGIGKQPICPECGKAHAPGP